VVDLDPIKQLQSLLDDRGKVLERISGIHSALNSLKSTGSTLAEPHPSAKTPPAVEAIPIAEDRLYDRLLNTLRDMQTQIEERVRPLAQEALYAEQARLREQSTQEHKALEDCLARMDQCILNCKDRINEYEKRHAELVRLNQRLATLGSEPEPLPEPLTAQNIAATISDRLGKLSLQGKL